MNSDRRTFLLMAGAAVIAGPAVQLAKGQGKAKVLLPHASWDCGMKDGIPNPESGSLIFETHLKLDRLRIPAKTNADSEGNANGIPGRRRTVLGA